MTSKQKRIADAYILNPLQTQRQIANLLSVEQCSVSIALNNPNVQAYIDEQIGEMWKKEKQKSMMRMVELANQNENMTIKYRANEFILKANGVGNEIKQIIEAGDEINITLCK